MPRPRFSKSVPHQRGVALIIILAFLVLLSGLVVAFFSRAMIERQVSNSSAHQTKVELFAEGAVATLIGDLKQEIAAGSTAPASPPSPAANTHLHFPKTAATAVPARVGLPATPAALPNLVKRSAYQQPFFAGADYDATNYPPSDRAANVSTTTLSQNFRSWSAARWNKPLLLPKETPASDTDFTPVGGTGGFTAPDWVLVARNGSNPATWSAGLANATSNTFVTGRYAYNIYDEGGLLDMNVAGYPSGVTPAQASAKNALAFADLTQLKDATGASLLRQSEIDAIVSWRNYATTQAPAEFPTPAFTATSGLNFFNSMTANRKGFLTTANTALHNNQSDRMFASRQQLMKLLLSGIASQANSAPGKTERARLQNALQYLSHFSRDLNQPAFAPDPNRPRIVAVANGGNDAYTGDTIINPSFLQVRVPGTIGAASFKRIDGTDALGGEPLVKKRFSLNRLAWLTHKGPIASDNGLLSTDSEVQTVITSLKNAGFTEDFLKLGGPENIHKYFGLSWVTDPQNASLKVWVYSHQAGAPLTSANPPAANIKTLSGGSNPVAAREADFVELLRAGIAAGSVGKGFYNGGSAGSPDDYSYKKDVGAARQVIQITANIIDQFDSDGYPTRILYNDGTLPAAAPVAQEYRGVEDLPYFYRVRGSLMKVKESTPAITSRQNNPQAGSVAPGSEGLGVAFQQPEIWNPHTWNPSATSTSFRPTSFRLTAVTAPPSQTAPSSPDPNAMSTQPVNRYNTAGHQTCPPSNAPIKSISWTQDTTALLFDIPNNRPDLFREPTLLIKPQVPTGSNLRMGSLHYLNTEAVLAPYLSGGGIKNLAQSPFYTNNGATDNQVYIGIYMGAFPLLWNATIGGVASICNAFYVPGPDGKPVTYRVQYETTPGSGKWVTYDEKFTFVEMNNNANIPSVAGSRANWIEPAYTIGNDSGRCYFDPRTTRFHVPTCAWNYNNSRQQYEWPPTYSSYGTDFNAQQKSGAAASTTAYTAGNANRNAARQNALWSIRPDAFSGYVTYSPSAPLGWYQTGLGSGTGNQNFRPGMISQNNPSARSGGWCANQGVVGQGSAGTQIFFADADNVVRRGMAAYVVPTASDPGDPRVGGSSGLPAGATTGEPQQVATTYSAAGVATPDAAQRTSRPIMLNRPFRTVAELGYVFSDTPWRNLDFSTPESGSAALLDVFCLNDTDDSSGLVAGKVNLNTRQAPVLQAILAGAYKDEFTPATSLGATGNASANAIATALVSRTSDTAATFGVGSGPLANVSEVVGKWVTPIIALGTAVDGGKSYKGFSGVETTTVAPLPPSTTAPQVAPNLSYLLSQDTSATGYTTKVVQRYRNAAIRALASAGQTRVWNLMIDVVAQTGRYPLAAKGLDQFVVEGEQRCWVHVAIDRFTGEVIDRQIELVKE